MTEIPADVSNVEFFERYASPGRVGVVGGANVIDLAISAAQQKLGDARKWSSWSHAFIFQGRRVDGHHWVVESDLDVHTKHMRLGVQENRVAKYCDDEGYPRVAVLDFGLSASDTEKLLSAALDLVSQHVQYSIRELFGTLLAIYNPKLRGKGNLFERPSSVYCSAFVRLLFDGIGMNLLPEIEIKNTAPEDLLHSAKPHQVWTLQRTTPESDMKVALGKRPKKVSPS